MAGKQLSAKEMWQSMQKANDDNRKDETDQTIHLPTIFSEHVDIRPLELTDDNKFGDHNYSVSLMARHWISEHSNLNEIVSAYFEQLPQKDLPKSSYVGIVIRSVMSSPSRKLTRIFRNFKFDCTKSELIARTLLSNPNIATEQDLEEFYKFNNERQLMLCEISLGNNNPVHDDAKKFIEEKRKKQEKVGRPFFQLSQLEWALKRKEYLRQNIIQEIYIRSLTVSGFEEISNFKSICERDMRKKEIDEKNYKKHAKNLLQAFKTVQGAFLLYPYFVIDPRYDLITNIMNDEQQNTVAESYDLFYRRTNAREVLRRLADRTSKNDFCNLYKSRNQFERKSRPFNNLCFIEESEEVSLMPEEIAMDEATKVQKVVSTEQPVGGETSSNRSVETVIQVPVVVGASQVQKMVSTEQPVISSQVPAVTEAPEVENMPVPEILLVDCHPNEAQLLFIRTMASDGSIVRKIKLHLREKYKSNFEDVWRENRTIILMNFIYSFLDESFEEFQPFVSSCSSEVMETARNFFEIHQKKNGGKTKINSNL